MEYVHAALLLHGAGKKIDVANMKKVLEAAGVKPEEARIKALVASLEGVNIDEAIEKAAMPVAAPAVSAEAAPKEEAKEEKKEEEVEKKAEEAAAGLGALFG